MASGERFARTARIRSAPVLVLLPPSEGKTAGGSGPPLGRRLGLSVPDLAPARRALVSALRTAAVHDRAALATGLKLPPGLAAAALAADSSVTRSPTLPALDRYAGVVYAALDVATLSEAARRRAETGLLVFSGLWGVLRGGDPVPDYRVPASGTVPGLGGVTAHWRAALAEVLPHIVGDEAVVDLRSSDYRAMWRPAGPLREQVVAVRVLAEKGTGARRTVGPVSFHAKTVKGLLARRLVAGRTRNRDPMAAVVAAADALDLRVQDTSTRGARSVDLVGRYTPGVVPSAR